MSAPRRGRSQKKAGAAAAAYAAACAHDRRGEEGLAIPCYEAALAARLRGDDRAGALVGLGSSLRNVGRLDDAEAVLARAVAERPRDAAAATFLALVRHSRGDGHAAVASLLDLALAHAPLGPYDRALRFYTDEVRREESQQGGLVAARTVDFVAGVLPRRRCRILDVGCGDGRIAVALQSYGHEVTGLDTRAAAVEEARGRGVPALCVDFLGHDTDERYDAIVFSRSFHHMTDLVAAARHAASLLAPRGRVIGEEFAVERMDRATVAAFDALRGEPGSLAEWRRHHARHGVHPASAMRRALASAGLVLRRDEPAPYLFHYLCDAVPAEGAGRRLGEQWLALEQAQIAAGAWRAVGWRFVAVVGAATVARGRGGASRVSARSRRRASR